MPSCAISICGNRSNNINYKTCGVTYHLFPKDPKIKEKWIDATGRKNRWFPTKHSVICSSHFEEKCFLPTATSRRLSPKAVPTTKLRLVYDTSTVKSKDAIHSKKAIIKRPKSRKIIHQYKIQIEKYKNAVKEHQLHIKRLQTMVRRYRRKCENLKNILNALKNANVIGEEHQWLLESDSIPN